jgi:hypothetical protein
LESGGMEVGMNGGPAFDGLQYCHGGIINTLFVRVAKGGFCKLEAL